MRIENDNDLILVESCTFLHVVSLDFDSAIEIYDCHPKCVFTISSTSFINCSNYMMQVPSCISTAGCKMNIIRVCCDGDFSDGSTFCAITGSTGNDCIINATSISNSVGSVSGCSECISITADNIFISRINFSRNFGDSCKYFIIGAATLLGESFYDSMTFSSNRNCSKLNIISKGFRINNLAFENNSGPSTDFLLILFQSMNGTISDFYDFRNDIGFVYCSVPNLSDASTMISIDRYITDRTSYLLSNFTFTNVLSFTGNYQFGGMSLCSYATFPQNATTSTSSYHYTLRVVLASLGSIIAVLVISLGLLYVFYRRKSRRISELTKVIDLDDALASMT